jgi:hypothetical protein
MNHNPYFVLVTATAEKPVSRKYAVTKGREAFIALSDKLR